MNSKTALAVGVEVQVDFVHALPVRDFSASAARFVHRRPAVGVELAQVHPYREGVGQERSAFGVRVLASSYPNLAGSAVVIGGEG